MLALYMNRPLTDVDGLLAGRCFRSGMRRRNLAGNGGGEVRDDAGWLSSPRKVLVLDDSVRSGEAMAEVRERLTRADLPHELIFGAVYADPAATDKVDTYYQTLKTPRVFEWNVFHVEALGRWCVDMDGVLGAAGGVGRWGDGSAAGTALNGSGAPRLVPSHPVGWLVTARPERHRRETEKWLAHHGVQYRHLIMSDGAVGEDGEDGNVASVAAAHKADAYRRSGARLFIEESCLQAVEIARLSGRPVLCAGTMQMVFPDSVPVARPAVYGDRYETPPTVSEAGGALVRAVGRAVLPDTLRRRLRASGANGA